MDSILTDSRVIAVLIGVIVGGIITFFLTLLKDFLIEEKKQKENIKQLKREKLEDVFTLLEQVHKNALLPMQLYKDDVESAKLTMLIRFYFPNIYSEYQKFVKEYAEITKLKISQKDYLERYKNGFSKTYHDLCNQIVEESKKFY